MESEKTIHDVIKERMTLPKEVKSFIKINIFFNILMAILMLVATIIINITYSKATTESFENYIHIFQIVFALITIIAFEISYKKDSFLMSLYGIELFVFTIAVMFVPYCYILKNNFNIMIILNVLFAIYYILKSAFTASYLRKDYLRNNISDVKEIVKDNKKGYIDEKSTKTLRENKVKQEDSKSKKVAAKKVELKNVTTKKTESKKASKPKKVESKKTESKKVDKKEKEYSSEKLNENLNKLKKMKENK